MTRVVSRNIIILFHSLCSILPPDLWRISTYFSSNFLLRLEVPDETLGLTDNTMTSRRAEALTEDFISDNSEETRTDFLQKERSFCVHDTSLNSIQ